MRTFAHKRKRSRKAKSGRSAKPVRAWGQSRSVSAILHSPGQQPAQAKAPPGDHTIGPTDTTRNPPTGNPKKYRRLDRVFGEGIRPPSDAQWRVPPSADLQSMLTSGTVDEAVVHSRVHRLLERMNREGRLSGNTTYGDIGAIMNEIFPSPGVLDQAAYERYIDPADRTMVYHSVQDASAAPRSADRGDLRNAMQAAANTAQSVAADEAGLRAVFGPVEWTTARTNYGLIRSKLNAVSTDIANRVTTDYNLDAQETFLGGWASFRAQHMHLLSEVVADPLTAESKATLVHEAAHLAASSIDDDHGYYGTTGFEAKSHAAKVNNAAHYEELPRRVWGVSQYAGETFTPGVSSGGAPLTTEDRIREDGAEYYQRAWDAAADFDDLIKQARRDQLNGTALDGPTVARLLEVSPLMGLTLHEQLSSPPDITRLDVTTSESVVRAMGIAGDNIEALPNVVPSGAFPNTAAQIAAGVDQAVDAAMAAYGGLLGSATRDRRLSDWLHSHYRNVFP
ncbi:hypothetical protein [Saccharospirillum salsuginis]|nr:hypothetical protein [Saccharospirillum salsuginis]